ncbi:MAG: single-stranded-DNA-specific exonuclease RecJ [Bacteroidales bacterium]|nr:single-stranded-DNA-specific exonuclease RecJ [Bacteroidales bacterium]
MDILNLSKALNGLHPVLTRLLLQRGIKTYDEAKEFFRPSLLSMHNPFLMMDMEKAVDRVNNAIDDNEKVLVYGDYDVDGTTAVALVYSYLKPYVGEGNIGYYVPDRYNEGYGISYKGIDYANEHGYTLVIALDCGIKAVEKVAYAKQKGIDFIICDHHTPGDRLPEAAACLDPKRDDCTYPDKNLSGCGVGFKLMQAFCRMNDQKEDDLLQYLDILAVSIASDIVPMTGENRVLAYHGLKKLNENPSIGLKSIIEVAGLQDKEMTVSDIVFKIGPRINAAGRMKSGIEAVRLLISDDRAEADLISHSIDNRNEERKDLDRTITQEALNMIESSDEMKKRKSTVLFNPEWHKGVVGIVASRLTETYYRPTIILTMSNGFATGSARSVEGFDLYKAIDSCSDLLENFGGHTYAAGLTMKVENVEHFIERFEQYVAANISDDQMLPSIDIDAEIHLSDITPQFYNILTQFEPFGPGNIKPVFVTNGVYDYGTSKLVGKDKDADIAPSRKHLKLEVTDPHSRGTMQGVAFNMGDKFKHIHSGKPFNLCYTIEMNEFRGNKNLQIMVRDIHES